MYPTVSFFLEDFFGIHLPLPVRTFGFFLALAFFLAGWISYRGFRRLEQQGLLQGMIKEEKIGEAARPVDLFLNAFFGFLVGYKLVYMVSNWVAFSNRPEDFLLNFEGSVVGGLIFSIIFAGLHYYEKQSQRLPEPKLQKRTIYPSDRLGDMIVIAAITGILGAKIFTWIGDPESFLAHPLESLLSFSGLTFYGGLICAALALIVYTQRLKIPLGHFADVGALGVIVGYAVGRLGCHFSGDGDWGIVNEQATTHWLSFLPDWMWAYTYPNNVISAGTVQIPDCVGEFCRELAAPVFPTSVYEFLMGMGILGLLILVRNSFKIPGLVFAGYLILNGIERFFIEMIRVNDRSNFLGFSLSQAQKIAIFMFLGGILLSIFLLYRQRQQPSTSTV